MSLLEPREEKDCTKFIPSEYSFSRTLRRRCSKAADLLSLDEVAATGYSQANIPYGNLSGTAGNIARLKVVLEAGF